MIDLVEFEGAVKGLPNVLGCVILTDESGQPAEVEVFVDASADQEATRDAVNRQIEARGLGAVRKVLVIELEAESYFGDRDSLLRAAELAEQEARARGAISAAEELSALAQDLITGATASAGGRPPLRKVLLSSNTTTYEAEVALGGFNVAEVVGQASAEKGPDALLVLAEATLKAASEVTGRYDFKALSAQMLTVTERKIVCVLVQMGDGLEVVGAALVREAPVAEAAVRATLDAINRRLATGK